MFRCSQVSEGLTLPLSGQVSAPSPRSNGATTAAESWPSTGRESTGAQTSRTSPTPTSVQLTLFPADSRASRFPSQEREEARRTTATYGRRCLESYVRLRRPGLSLRTFLASCLSSREWYSSAFALTWKLRDTRSCRSLFQLAPSGRGTGETEFSLWPTMKTSDANGAASTDGIKRGRQLRAIALKPEMFPTLLSRDCQSAKGGARMPGAQCTEPLVVQIGGQLNPTWCEWYMGFPEGWTE